MHPTKLILLGLTGAIATLLWFEGDIRWIEGNGLLQSPGEQPEEVSTLEAPHAGRQRLVYAPGRIEGKSREIEIRSTISERIGSIPVQEGEYVRQGDLLVVLDDRQLNAEMKLAEAQLATARARQQRLLNGARPSEIDEARAMQVGAAAAYRRAERMAKRTQELVQRGAASPQALDDEITQLATLRAAFDAADARLRTLAAPPREEDVAAAQADVNAAGARVELAQAALARTRLVAPFNLQVLRITAEPGELAGPDDLRPLLIVCDTSQLRVRAEVEEFDAMQVALGQSARIATDQPERLPLMGRVSQIAARMRQKQLHDERPNERLDATVREVWIDLDLTRDDTPSAAGLVIGLPVEVCFLPDEPVEASLHD